jgi:uncharacterized protein YndB with AHSA1/START domain
MRPPTHRVLLALLAIPVLAVAIVGIGGALLPEQHSVTRTVTLPASPERVWEIISDVQGQPRWRHDLKSVTMLPAIDGAEHWEEHAGMGSIPYVLTESDPNRRRVIKIADPNLSFGGTWTMTLSGISSGNAAVGTSDVPPPSGSTLTITENGVVHNVFFRFLGRFVFGFDTTIEQYEKDLAKAVAAHAPTR